MRSGFSLVRENENLCVRLFGWVWKGEKDSEEWKIPSDNQLVSVGEWLSECKQKFTEQVGWFERMGLWMRTRNL